MASNEAQPLLHSSGSTSYRTMGADSDRDPEADAHARRYGNTGHIHFHSAFEKPRPRSIKDLVSKPVIRQWIADGKLYREESSREMPRIELFFDLLYVGIIHQLAEVAVESPNGQSVGRFILTLWPAWSIWEEARRFSNVSGSDDLLHRIWVLCGMLCILGYVANASAIDLNVHGDAIDGEGVAGAVAERAIAFGARALQALAGDAAEGGAVQHPNGGISEALGQNTAVRAATAFFIIIKFTRVIVLWIYAWALPEFRVSQFLGGIAVLIPMCVYLPLIFVTSRPAQIGMAIAGMLVDMVRVDVLLYYIAGRYLQWQRRKREGIPSDHSLFKIANLPGHVRLPAINIEHSIDRSGAFVVIVLGEMIASLCYTATGPPHTPINNYGAGPMYGKAALGLMVAWALNFIYTIPTDSNVVRYEHALRHSWLTGVSFNFLHFPLCGALVLASSAAGVLLRHDEVPEGVEWFWGCGLGFTLLLTVSLDMLHHNLETWRAQMVPRRVRYAVGVAGSLVLMLLPLRTKPLTSTQNLIVGVAVTWTVLAVYVFGTIATRHAEVEEFHEAQITHMVLRDADAHSHVEHSRSLRSFGGHDEEAGPSTQAAREEGVAVL